MTLYKRLALGSISSEVAMSTLWTPHTHIIALLYVLNFVLKEKIQQASCIRLYWHWHWNLCFYNYAI